MILGPGPVQAPIPLAESTTDDPMFGVPLLQPGSDGDLMKWLDNMDWDQETWINFN